MRQWLCYISYGNMDFAYFIHTLENKQVTYMMAVPTFLNHLYDFIDKMNGHPLSTIRSLCSAEVSKIVIKSIIK